MDKTHEAILPILLPQSADEEDGDRHSYDDESGREKCSFANLSCSITQDEREWDDAENQKKTDTEEDLLLKTHA